MIPDPLIAPELALYRELVEARGRARLAVEDADRAMGAFVALVAAARDMAVEEIAAIDAKGVIEVKAAADRGSGEPTGGRVEQPTRSPSVAAVG